MTCSGDVSSYTLDFEAEYVDLDGGTTEHVDFGSFPENDGWDVMVAYNAGGTVHSVLFQNQSDGREIAHLTGASFDAVSAADAASASFTTSLIDASFDTDRVVLIRTDLGAVYKLGNPDEDDQGLTFDAALLD